MGEMENKMKNLDVNNDSNSLLTQIGRVDLETIDLNKILDELRNRDKTIASLRHVDQNVQGRLNAI